MARKVFLYLIIFTGLSGCDDKVSFSDLAGKYRGSWSAQSSGQISVTRVIEGKLDTQEPSRALLSFSCLAPDTCNQTLSLEMSSKGVLVLKSDLLGGVPIELKQDSDQNQCWRDGKTIACLADSELFLSWSSSDGARHWISLGKEATPPPLTPAGSPKTYQLNELVGRSFSKGFVSRIEYQRYRESRYNARATMLSLFPHVSTGTVSGIFGGLTPAAILQVSGDLLPFLLPSRWLQAKQSNLQSLAEAQAFTLTRLNAGLDVELLGYSIQRDEQILEYLEKKRGDIEKIYGELKVREELGQLDPNSSADVFAILNSIQQSQETIRSLLELEHQALAKAAGFERSEEIAAVEVTPEWSIDHPKQWTRDDLEQGFFAHAIELKQAEFLIKAARAGVQASYFTFLDPNAPPQLGLGPAIIPSIGQGKAQVQEFEAVRDQIRAQVLQTASQSEVNYRQCLVSRDLLNEAASVQQTRVNRMKDNLEFGTNFVLADLVNALQGQMQTEITRMQNDTAFYATSALIARMMLAGKYGEASFMTLDPRDRLGN